MLIGSIENTRSGFFKLLRFLRSEEVVPVFQVVPFRIPSLHVELNQMASHHKHGEVTKIMCEGNKNNWITFLEEMKEYFCYTAENSLYIEGSNERVEARWFIVENNLMDLEFQICVQWTGNGRVEGFLEKYSQSSHAVYLVARLFREILFSRARQGNQKFPTNYSSSELDSIVVHSWPLSQRTSQCLLQDVMELT